MKTNTLNWVSKFIKYTLLAIAVLYVVIFLILVFFRIQYPFELKWMEGALLEQVRRILSGQKLYVSPSLEFITFIYTPLYFYLSAAISSVVGMGFTPLRMVSFIASLGCFFVIFRIVWLETGNKFFGILSTGLFAASFYMCGGILDTVRPDSLFLFFLLTALYFIKFKVSLMSYILAGGFFSLAFLTKQTALIISLPVMLYCILMNPRHSVFFIGTIVAIVGTSTFFLNYFFDGWYNYYIFDLPGQHPRIKDMLIDFWTKDIGRPLFIVCFLALCYILIQILNSNKKNVFFYSLITIGMLGGAWVSRLHSGGVENVLLPAYAAFSLLFGLSLHALTEFFQSLFSVRKKYFEILLYVICIIQFTMIRYNPILLIPTQRDLEAGRNLINTIAKMDGEIFAPSWGYLPVLAGKKSYAHKSAINCILLGENGEVKNKFLNEINQTLREKKFSAIILDSEPWFPEIMEIIERYYVKQRLPFNNWEMYWTFNGKDSRPGLFYVPKDNNAY